MGLSRYEVVEICAGAGGQSLGLHRAGFDHSIAVELDENAAATLKLNSDWNVAVGDVADPQVWNPAEFEGVDLLAGGVPCPPFSVAGKQLGSADERDLFAWAVEQVGVMRPRAVMLENVRGLASARFAPYRQRVLDRLSEFGYVGDWTLLHASSFGLAQLRPRFVLVAMRPDDAAFFRWPTGSDASPSVGKALVDLMGARGWEHAEEWAIAANGVGPTLVGGSKKHGGADLGPTRAKLAWASLGVDGRGIADEAPAADAPAHTERAPRLTLQMAARLQGFSAEWQFAGKKTSQYRQIGNAFPPPVAEAVGRAIHDAFEQKHASNRESTLGSQVHDPIYQALALRRGFVRTTDLIKLEPGMTLTKLENRIAAMSRDFIIESRTRGAEVEYSLSAFNGFTGQADHVRHEYMRSFKGKVS